MKLWQVKLIMYFILSGVYFTISTDFNLYIMLSAFVILFINNVFIRNIRIDLAFSILAIITLIGLGVFHHSDWLIYLPIVHFIAAPFMKQYMPLSMLVYVFELEFFLIIFGLFSILIIYLITRIEALEQENNEIRDRLTMDNLKLIEQRNALSNDVEKEIELASLSERNRIARDMHDAVGHSLSSGLLLLESLHHIDDVDKIHRSLSSLQERLQTGMDDIRSSIHSLYSTSFDLKSRTEQLLDEMYMFEKELHYKVSSQLPYQIKIDLVAIVKESLTNIKKHSDGKWVAVYIIETDKAITLKVVDNGTVKDYSEYGMGLHSMKESVQKYGGIFNAGFQQHGYTVYVSINKEGLVNESNNR
ncbi:MAG TPA: histidine kinase [Aliicoccus persicus]|uniref:histidine kinase n=1 Tax=Aliicoccus persicus TaxID=930138 RepID=A0A921DYM2_9STAP|nr:histidine kinase [Aliicoccus persicus]